MSWRVLAFSRPTLKEDLKNISKLLKTAQYPDGFHVKLNLQNSLLGYAVFDVIEQTLGHQWVLVEVHQMRRLK